MNIPRDDGLDLLRVLLVCAIGMLAVVMLGCTSGSGALTVSGYVYFWLGILGTGLAIACAMAWWLVREVVIELRRIHIELGGLREQAFLRGIREARPKGKR